VQRSKKGTKHDDNVKTARKRTRVEILVEIDTSKTLVVLDAELSHVLIVVD
jgi:hypothetical protein